MATPSSPPDTLSWQLAPSTGDAPLPTVATPGPVLPQIVGFALGKELGRGGMGVVYEAVDQHLGRSVAVKMLLGGTTDPGRLERFKIESAALAKLQHPHILTVHQAGITADGHPFLVTELVPGGSLAQKISHRPQDPHASARLLLLLAKAVQTAHAAGILHRDLKPGNVLLAEPASEPALNCDWGWPKLADFGLAKMMDDGQPGATRTGAIMGSPPYMAPEQVIGDTAAIGPATDIYGLGAILYELLTGKPPYPNFFRDGPPAPPGQLRPDLDPGLEALCLKCLAMDPKERYPSVSSLIDGLQAYLSGVAVPATASFPPTPRPASRRKPWTKITAGALGLLCVGMIGLAWFKQDSTPTELETSAAADQSPLRGELQVLLWSDTDPFKRGIPVRTPGALPARHQEKMQILARVNRPAYIYLVLFDNQGKVYPLYPWNPGSRLGNKQFLPLPADIAPVAEIGSPPGRAEGWRLDKTSGQETVLLLARATPLDIDLGPLLAGLPPVPLRHAEELLVRGYDDGGPVQRLFDRQRGIDDVAAKIDEPLLQLIDRLRPHFSVVHVVRFAHQGP